MNLGTGGKSDDKTRQKRLAEDSSNLRTLGKFAGTRLLKYTAYLAAYRSCRPRLRLWVLPLCFIAAIIPCADEFSSETQYHENQYPWRHLVAVHRSSQACDTHNKVDLTLDLLASKQVLSRERRYLGVQSDENCIHTTLIAYRDHTHPREPGKTRCL